MEGTLGSRLVAWLPLIPLLPLLGFLLNGLFGKKAGRGFVTLVGVGTPLAGFALTAAAFLALVVEDKGSVVVARAQRTRSEIKEKLQGSVRVETDEDKAEGVLRVLGNPEDVRAALGATLADPTVQVKSSTEYGPRSWHGPATKEGRLVKDIPWIAVGGFDVSFRFVLDRLSGVLALVVLGVGSLIHIYSVGYMSTEDRGGFARYFAYLNLFTGMMLVLALAGDILLMFVGWEGVGLASYLLIGFDYREGWKADAGIKAFVVNRVGDFGFMLGVLGLAMCGIAAGNNDLRIDHINALAVAGKIAPYTLGAAALCLFLGATGKSAQIPLFVWLPDAMAGPTPVSALIHAATMVTSGVYMVCRLHPIFDNAVIPGTHFPVLGVVAGIGAATAIYAATCAVAQDDIKKVCAYSTVSQLGYMFLAAGVSAYGAAIFHLVTHAFFKALLFLGAGSVIHGTGTQDMKKMGGLKDIMRVTYATMLVGALCLAGFPFTSGYFSKDMILGSAFMKAMDHGSGWWLVYVTGVVGGLLTAFYSTRLIALTFWNKPGEASQHAHESPDVMTVPLVVLACLSILGGLLGLPELLGHVGNWMPEWLKPLLAPIAGEHAAPAHGEEAAAAHHAGREMIAIGISTVAALVGIAAGFKTYVNAPLPAFEIGAGPLAGVRAFLANAWGIDAAYRRFIVEPVMAFAHGLWEIADAAILDRGLVDGAGRLARGFGELASSLETGRVSRYAAYLAVGAVALIAAAVLGG
ncbi:MAG: NADH-quinone oxidoreductase subunit L [Planctomycetota bacterium]